MADDIGPLARLEDVKRDPAAPGEVFRRLAGGERLSAIWKDWGLPKGRATQWFTVEHADLYDAALKVLAVDLALDAMDAALAATPEDVAVRKLQADVAFKLASRWDRARYGESVKVEQGVTLAVDAGLLGTMGELLRLAAEGKRPALPEPRVIEHSSTHDEGHTFGIGGHEERVRVTVIKPAEAPPI